MDGRRARWLSLLLALVMIVAAAPAALAQTGPDTDGDGIEDEFDNCPAIPNPDQDDYDFDGLGNVCDPDMDDDGLSNTDEATHGTDPLNEDTDGDGYWDGIEIDEGWDPLDECDPDECGDYDADGVTNDTDNCPFHPNPGQEDTDEDGVGDACVPPVPVASTTCTDDPPLSVQAGGVQNIGFETGALAPWREGSKIEGSTVVGTDNFISGVVAPWEGTKMVRLGESSPSADKRQQPGANEICQDFVVDAAVERFAFNVVTYDYSGFDDLRFDVKVKDPDTNETLASYQQEAWGPSGDTSLKTSGWRGAELDLTGHIGETVRLMISSGGTSDSLYPFWVYVDSADERFPEGLVRLVDVRSDTASVTTDSSAGTATVAVPSLSPSDITFDVEIECPEATTPGEVTLLLDGNQFPMTDPDANGIHTTTIPQAQVGDGELTVSLTCGPANIVSDIGQIVMYPPIGTITDSDTDDPIEEADVLLHVLPGWTAKSSPDDNSPNTCQSNASKNPGDPWNQAVPPGIGQVVNPFSSAITPGVNPFSSNPNGLYGWILEGGCWYVVVSADGYETKTSPVFGTPPTVSDMNVELDPIEEDTTPPETTITVGPAAGSTTNSSAASFEFTSSESPATFECKLDAGDWGPCTTPRNLTGLSDGSHTFMVRATDAAGNTDETPASRTWTVDTTAPNTTITAGPTEGSTTNMTLATFEFTSTEGGSTFECKLDAGDWGPCTTPRNLTGLSDGSHTFMVRATDAAGNTDQTPASRTWTVDTTAPDTTITSGPAEGSVISESSATFGFISTETGSTFECKLDGDDWGSCTNPKTYSGLSVGSHTVMVRATDASGNTDQTPATRTFMVEEQEEDDPPNTEITKKPKNRVKSRTARFVFRSSEPNSTFQCKLDGGPWRTCSSPKVYRKLSKGEHTFKVRAIDAEGNVDPTPAVRNWRIVSKRK